MNKALLFILPIIGGLLSFLAWQPTPLFFLIFIAWCPLLLIEDYFSNKYKSTAKLKLLPFTFLFFFSWNTLVTYWLFYASVIGTLCAVVANSLLMCLPFLLFHQSKKKFGPPIGYVSFIIFWLSFEYLHQNWELSWSWLNLGNVFSNFPAFIQWYEYTGSAGGTLWILLVNLLLFSIIKKTAINPPNITNFIQMIKTFASIIWQPVLLLFLPIVFSLFIYNTYSEEGEKIEALLIQPNIDPYQKFNSDLINQNTTHLLNLSKNNLTKNTDYILWPETAIPQYLYLNKLETYSIINNIKQLINNTKTNLITGAATLYKYSQEEQKSATSKELGMKGEIVDIYNSALQITDAEQIQIYHKSKLVPGAENMPFSNYFHFLDEFLVDLGGIKKSLASQTERGVFAVNDGFTVAPIICYESIYGAYVTEYVKKGANFLFIITNDAWWGNSAGHKQHLSYASLRAIETRRSIARSANTGISCFINQRGDIVAATKYDTSTTLLGSLTSNDKITLFVKYGDVISRISLAISLLIFFNLIVSNLTNDFKMLGSKRASAPLGNSASM